MSHLGIPTINYIMQKSGRKPTACSCEKCKSQCRTPCLGTPEDIERLIDAGYKDRLAPTEWLVGMLFGVIDRPGSWFRRKLRTDGVPSTMTESVSFTNKA